MVNLLVLSNPAASHLKPLESLPGPVEVTVGDDVAKLAQAAPDADAIFNAVFGGALLRAVFPLARKVRWVHNLSAGVESVMFPELIESHVPLTNGRGVFAESLSEFVIAAALFFAKDLRRMVHNQEARRWETFDVELLAGRTMGVVGYGEIGRASARLAHASGMRVCALRRRTTLSEADPLLDAIYPPDRIQTMLSECDYVVVAAPLTPETRGMIGAPEIEAMKSNAVVINVGRGPIIDEGALIAALRAGRIRGAALDVFDEEPLPEQHPFWTMPNVLVSPHTADHTQDGWMGLATQMFVRNFDRFIKGEPLGNVVDKRAGY
jgi:phosphoglycerate dehydrogenase-like enzyme